MKAQNGAWDIMGVQWLFMWQENRSVDFPPMRLEIEDPFTAPESQVGDPRLVGGAFGRLPRTQGQKRPLHLAAAAGSRRSSNR